MGSLLCKQPGFHGTDSVGFFGPAAQVILHEALCCLKLGDAVDPKEGGVVTGKVATNQLGEEYGGGGGTGHPKLMGKKLREESSPKCQKKNGFRNCRIFSPEILEKQF